MNKLKAVARRLLGRKAPTPYTVDSVSKTLDGYCVIGWYFEDIVSTVKFVDAEKKDVKSNLSRIERPDVAAQTGRPGAGFQITCKTSKGIEEILLAFPLTDGNELITALSLTGNVAEEVPGTGGPLRSTSKGEVKGSCEFAIVSDEHVFVSGWVMDGGNCQQFRLETTHGDTLGEPVDVLRYTRKDVKDAFGEIPSALGAGFFATYKRRENSQFKLSSAKIAFEYRDHSEYLPISMSYEAAAEPMTNAQRVLNHWLSENPTHLSKASLFNAILHDIYPAESPVTAKRLDFGAKPEKPVCTFIIPLYGRYDFLRYQLSHFSRYSQYENCEILYVVDDPSIANKTTALAREMAVLTSQPFSLILLSQNVGFGRANNIGVEHAHSDMLLLLNSDVLPKDASWLQKMMETASRENAGIVGARLLFEDDTIQHDGMSPMQLNEYPGLLFNDHPFKGWPLGLSPNPANEAQCPLITAACWMLKKSLFVDLGGFDPVYVLGDFEDSDLCLKSLRKGKTNYIRRDVTLYHLERQSQNLVKPGRWKHNITILNAITFNARWQNDIEKLTEVGK